MSQIENKLKDKVFGPPVFPFDGRLPTEVSVVGANYNKQTAEENRFGRQRDSQGRGQRFEYCHSLRVSLFIDETNNNDTKKNQRNNYAKIYHVYLLGPEATVWIEKAKVKVKVLCGLLGLALLGCASAENEMAAGNLAAINHVEGTVVNWFSVDGYRAHGGGGSSCCIVMPVKWRPGLKAEVEWEVDPEPFAKIKRKTTGYGFDEEAWARHQANFRRNSVTVDIPEWPEKKSCSLNVHFLTCNRVKVTTSCAVYGQPNYPIQEPLDMKEPSVCPK